MKTTFARQFALTAGMVILCVALLGAGFRVLLYNNLVEQKKDALLTNGTTVAQYSAAYDSITDLGSNWDFRMSLSFASNVSDIDLLVCDAQGQVVVCSCSDLGCAHTGKILVESLVSTVFADGYYYNHDLLSGLYDQDRHYIAVPITNQSSGEIMGLVLSSSQAENIDTMLSATFEIFFFSAALVLLVALAGCSMVAKSEAEQLRHLANTAHRFGLGDMKARATVSPRHTTEMQDLATEFNAMATSLEQSELRRKEFVANVSHELKTPMTTISGFVDGMIDGTIPPARHRQYMKTVSDEVRRLSRLVHNMLDISRLQSQGISETKKQRFNITESVGQVLLTFEQKIEGKNIQVIADLPDAPVFVWAELDTITQVLSNLTDNAVKFCPIGGELWVNVSQVGGKAAITVGNTGKTIPPDELPLLFDRFHKLDKSRSKDRDGYGLGLYIVKTIIDSHGEDIVPVSQDGRTQFTFHLPLKK